MLLYKVGFGYLFGFRVSAGLVLEWIITRIGVRCGFGFRFRVSGLGAQRLLPIRIRHVAIPSHSGTAKAPTTWTRSCSARSRAALQTAGVPISHSRESPGMFQLPNPGIDPRCLPWFRSKHDFSVVAPVFYSPMLHIYVAIVSDVFRCML
jgi:hypothetical protein